MSTDLIFSAMIGGLVTSFLQFMMFGSRLTRIETKMENVESSLNKLAERRSQPRPG